LAEARSLEGAVKLAVIALELNPKGQLIVK
jgi:hypothetical protein